jgi:hypothetical protein
MISCYVSVGEYCDKYTILKIKKDRIKDPEKLKFVDHELSLFSLHFDPSTHPDACYLLADLRWINEKLWDCNESRKLKIKNNELDDEFIRLSVLESQLNDQRNAIKSEFNALLNSEIVEQKSYL